jgi:hypothetical protein
MEDVLREYKLQNYAKRLGQEAKPNFKQRTGSNRQTAEQK